MTKRELIQKLEDLRFKAWEAHDAKYEAFEKAADLAYGLDNPHYGNLFASAFSLGQTVYFTTNGIVYSSTVEAVKFTREKVYYSLADDWGGYEDEFYATEAGARASLPDDPYET